MGLIKAVEVTGTVDERRELHLDEPLPVAGSGPVRVIVLFEGKDDPTEEEWLKAAASNPVFDFLKDPEEDIYSPDDGKPFAIG